MVCFAVSLFWSGLCILVWLTWLVGCFVRDVVLWLLCLSCFILLLGCLLFILFVVYVWFGLRICFGMLAIWLDCAFGSYLILLFLGLMFDLVLVLIYVVVCEFACFCIWLIFVCLLWLFGWVGWIASFLLWGYCDWLVWLLCYLEYLSLICFDLYAWLVLCVRAVVCLLLVFALCFVAFLVLGLMYCWVIDLPDLGVDLLCV